MTEELAAWLPAQRWFRAKGRPIAGVAIVDRAAVGPAELRVMEVTYGDGGAQDRYLAPFVDDREPHDGEGAWAAIARAILDGAGIGGEAGAFTGHPIGAGAGAGRIPAGPGERRLGVEQSNTSAVIGERLILKLYRRLEPGTNPDVEVGAFLADAGFADVPTLAGWLGYAAGGEASAAAMLQEFVPGAGDAWAAMLEALATDGRRAAGLATTIGDVTARLHAALASRPDHPAFPSRPATVAETVGWRASAEGQLAQAIAALSGDAHDRLHGLAPAVRARFADAFGAAGGETRIARIHGDYHLGQLLARPDGGLSVIDFEGEPARPLDERRGPSSPLRDVAGMLRSLDYAARTVERGSGRSVAGGTELRAAFLAAYGAPTVADAALLDAFELEKACYEVRYEARNRPDWLWLPMEALERLAGGAG